MYGIFTYIWLIFMVNVGKYTIHGSYGIGTLYFVLQYPWYLVYFQEIPRKKLSPPNLQTVTPNTRIVRESHSFRQTDQAQRS